MYAGRVHVSGGRWRERRRPTFSCGLQKLSAGPLSGKTTTPRLKQVYCGIPVMRPRMLRNGSCPDCYGKHGNRVR